VLVTIELFLIVSDDIHQSERLAMIKIHKTIVLVRAFSTFLVCYILCIE